MDHTPWGGWELTNTGEDLALGPIESPVGSVRVEVEAGVLSLWKGEQPLLSTDIVGRLSQLRFVDGLFSAALPETLAGGYLTLPHVDGDRVLMARAGDRKISWGTGPEGMRLTLGPEEAGANVTVVWRD